MKKKSFWLVIGLMIATLVFALVGCKDDNPTTYKLSETSISLSIGEQKQLKISPTPKAAVSWEAEDTSVATVENGLIFAVGTGNTTVTATIAGVDNALTCTVTVTEEKLEVDGYSLDYTNVSLKTAETFQLSVLNEAGQSPASVTWSSGNNAVATVSETGLITAAGVGETMVSAKLAGGTLVCKVTVTQGYSYSLDKSALDLAVGGTGQLTLITTPEPDDTNTRPHTFSSSDTNVAEVEGGTGKVTGIGKGTATITCLVDGQELTATVKVTEYTLTIDEAAWTNTLELRVSETANIAVTADPAGTITADYHSDDESVVTAANGVITAVDLGTTNVTVTIGGRTWTTTVTVRDQYEYSFENDEITLKLGESGTLTVLSDPTSEFAVTFEPAEAGIVTLTSEGTTATVTAVGLGDVTIVAKITGTSKEIRATVHVVFGVEKDTVEYSAGQSYSVNLDKLDETYETLDWIYYGKENYIERKNGGSLLGTFSGQKESDFYDYRVGIGWSDGTTTKENASGRVDGITLKNGSFTVKVTSDVKYIAIFTGVYHGTNTTTISYNGAVCATVTFENNGDNDAINKNKQVIFTPDIDKLIGTEMEFTISFEVSGESSHGWADNISLVAVAVVGNTERQGSTPSATAETPVVTALTDTTINLSTIGNEDWVYANNGGSMARKKDVSNVIKENEISYSENPGTDPLDNGFGWFNWFAADGSAPTADGQVRHFRHVGATYSIPVHLTTGTHTVTLYLSGWKNSYFVSVLDGNDNLIVNAHQVVEGNGSTSKAVKVVVTLTVTKEDDFAFRMTKSGDGNHGWAAIAVSNETAFELTQREYALEIGGETAQIQLSGTSSVTYESANTGIATVSEQGVITAVALGTTYITITDGNGAQNRVFVTVSKAASLNKTSLTLTLDDEGKKSDTLKVLDGDDEEVTEDVTFTSSNNFVVTVSENGLVEAKALGKATITVQFGPTTFTCEVEVISPNAELIELDWDFENLSAASSTYKTIAYKHWNSGNTVMMPTDNNPIAEPNGANDNFWDYKTTIGYEFNAGSNRNVGMSYGKLSKESFTINVTLNNNVTGIVFYTGAYQGTAVVSFKIGEKTLTTVAFTATEGIARKIAVEISASDLTAGQTLVIEGRVENKTGDGNVNVVAAALIGNDPQNIAATGSATSKQLGEKGSNQVDLDVAGSYDWLYSQYDGVGTYRKFGGNNVFQGETYYNKDGGTTNPENEWDGRSAFKWTNGMLTSDSGAEAGSANPVDNDGPWDKDATGGVDGYTNNYYAANGEIHIAMKLTEGTYTIRVYLNSWQSPQATGIYDGEGNFVTGKLLINADINDQGQGWEVTYTITVTQESTYKLVIGKARSHGDTDRKIGWQAVAVAKND